MNALITGAGRGFGREFALALAAQGYNLTIASRTPAQLEETAQLIRAAGAQALPIAADVTVPAQVDAMVASAISTFGPIDLLINNAGAGRPYGPIWDSNLDEWWRTMEVNVRGPLLTSAAVLKHMTARRSGRIINIASGAGTISVPFFSAYVTSKTAVIRLTETMADETRPYGIRVFAVQPGTVKTALSDDVLTSPEGKRWLPWFEKMFAAGDGSFTPGVQLILELASGRCDALSGRMLSAETFQPALIQNANEIRARELHVLRIKFFGK